MKKLQHAAIYVHSDTNRQWLIEQISAQQLLAPDIDLAELAGEVYSSVTLQYFIDEELKHDHFEIATGLSNTLSTSSSGEQRKALLTYILSKEPDFIILDDVFESLDKNARQVILQQLEKIADKVLLVQVLTRKTDILPFIQRVHVLEGTKLMVQHRDEFLSIPAASSKMMKLKIPPPLASFPFFNGPIVKMTNVSVSYDERPILNGINWQINQGDFWQLIGPNGAGKSTLLSMITGDNPKAYGQDIVLFGQKKGSGETVWQIKEKIGYVSPVMIRHFERQDSILQMIISGFFDSVGLYIKPTDMQVKSASAWLNLIGLQEKKHEPFRLISSGQQRMVLIARAMVKHPPLLILDEPATGLDDTDAGLFTELVNQIAGETSTAILYVSHRPEPGLQPRSTYELTPSPSGSMGKVIF